MAAELLGFSPDDCLFQRGAVEPALPLERTEQHELRVYWGTIYTREVDMDDQANDAEVAVLERPEVAEPSEQVEQNQLDPRIAAIKRSQAVLHVESRPNHTDRVDYDALYQIEDAEPIIAGISAILDLRLESYTPDQNPRLAFYGDRNRAIAHKVVERLEQDTGRKLGYELVNTNQPGLPQLPEYAQVLAVFEEINHTQPEPRLWMLRDEIHKAGGKLDGVIAPVEHQSDIRRAGYSRGERQYPFTIDSLFQVQRNVNTGLSVRPVEHSHVLTTQIAEDTQAHEPLEVLEKIAA